MPTYLAPAILTTIFCCLPFGIVSIVYAAQVNGKLAAGTSRRSALLPEGQDVGLDLVRHGAPAHLGEGVAAVPARDRLPAAASVLGTVGVLGTLYIVNPGTSVLYPTCPFLWATGCYCQGCGSLRALHQITRGHLAAAFGLNPLLVPSLPFVAYFFASQASLVLRGRPLRGFFVRPYPIWSLLVVVILYWIARNLPAYPFSLLAP